MWPDESSRGRRSRIPTRTPIERRSFCGRVACAGQLHAGTSGYPGGRLLGGAVRDGERGRAPSGALVRALKSSPRLSAVPCLPLHYSNLCIDLHSDRRLPHVCRDRRLIWAGCGPSVRAGAAGHVARRKKLAPDLRPFLWRCALSSSLLEKFYRRPACAVSRPRTRPRPRVSRLLCASVPRQKHGRRCSDGVCEKESMCSCVIFLLAL